MLALAYPDRVAKARGGTGAFVMANGRGAMVEPHDALAREPYLAIAEIAGGAVSARILLAAPLDAWPTSRTSSPARSWRATS